MKMKPIYTQDKRDELKLHLCIMTINVNVIALRIRLMAVLGCVCVCVCRCVTQCWVREWHNILVAFFQLFKVIESMKWCVKFARQLRSASQPARGQSSVWSDFFSFRSNRRETLLIEKHSLRNSPICFLAWWRLRIGLCGGYDSKMR